MAESVDWDYQWDQIVARAWADAAFKKRLLADPAAVLKDYGLAPPAGTQLKVVENTDKVLHLVLPLKPAPEELSEEELQRVSGGHCHRCGCERCRCERCGCERCGCARCRCERCRC
jgi:hypothetical protein